jgi:sortase A
MRWSQFTLAIAGVAAVAYCGIVLTETWLFRRKTDAELDQVQLRMPTTPGPGIVASGGLVGRLEVVRLGMSVAIAEGTTEGVLRHAAGHIEGTTFPGMRGNVGIAGHRDTLFQPLRNIRQNDVILLTTLQGQYRYRVVLTQIVPPSDVGVLVPDGGEILTLVTCHPFFFFGPAPNRFIVRAQRIA